MGSPLDRSGGATGRLCYHCKSGLVASAVLFPGDILRLPQGHHGVFQGTAALGVRRLRAVDQPPHHVAMPGNTRCGETGAGIPVCLGHLHRCIDVDCDRIAGSALVRALFN